MAGIGDSWGTKEELLHPRGPDGRWIRSGGVPKGLISRVLEALASFRPRMFQSQGQANSYVRNVASKKPARFNGGRGYSRLMSDLGPTNEDLRDGVIDNPSTSRFIKMMDDSATELPDDVILTRYVGVDAFGFTPQTAQGTDSDTDPGIRGMSGKLVADRGYSTTVIGEPRGAPPQGSVRMVIAGRKGTKVIIPGSGQNDSTVFLDRDQPLRITKIEDDGNGGWVMYTMTEEDSRAVPEPIGGPVGAGIRDTKQREAAVREGERIQATQEKRPDDVAEAEDAQRRRAATEEGQKDIVPSPMQEAERRRIEQLQQEAGVQPRTEPIQARSIGGEPRPETAPGGQPQAPEAPATPRRTVDLRLAVRDAGIRRPEAGKNRKQWNDAYEGIISGKKDPIDAAQELDRDADDLAEIGHPDAESFRQLSDLIQREYGTAPPEPAKATKKAVPRTAAGLPKVTKSQLQEVDERAKAAKATRAGKATAPEAAPAPTPVKAAKKSGMTPDQEDRVVARARDFRGNESNDEERRIVGQADEILARRRGEEPAKALPPVAKKAPAKMTAPAELTPEEQIKGLFNGKRPTNAQLREMGERNNLGFGPKEPRSEMILAILGARPSRGRQVGEEPVKAPTKKASSADRVADLLLERMRPDVRDQILADMPEGERREVEAARLRVQAAKKAPAKAPAKKAAPEAPGDDLDRMTKKELIAEAGRRGITARDSWTKDKIKAAFRQREEAGAEAPAPVKKTAKAAPRKLNSRNLSPGDRVIWEQPGELPVHGVVDRQGTRVFVNWEGGRRERVTSTGDGGMGPNVRLASPEEIEEHGTLGPPREKAPAPAKAAVPEAAPGTAAGKITAGRLQPGMRIIVSPEGRATNRKTGGRTLTITAVDRVAPNRARGDRQTRIQVRGTDENGNEVTVPSVGSSLTFIMAPEPGAAPAKKAAKAAPDKVQVARARQEEIFGAKRYSDTAAELDQLIADDASDKAILARFDQATKNEGLQGGPMDSVRAHLEAGDRDSARAEMARILEANGVTPTARAGDVVPFNRREHTEIVGTDIAESDMVRIVRPGHRARIRDEEINLGRSVVEPATPDEVSAKVGRTEVARKAVPKGSVKGDRPQAPIDNEPRKRTFTEAWDAADLGGEGSPGRSIGQIRDEVASGKLTPEEGIRRMEDEVAFNKEDLAEVDATLRQPDLTDAQRARLQSDAAKLQNGIEAQERASKFMRLYFADEKPTVTELKVQVDDEGFRALQAATPEDLRRSAQEQGLDPPKGETKDEILQDMIVQTVKKMQREKGPIKKAAPAKKAAKKAAPQIPADREKLDIKVIGAGIEFGDDKWTRSSLEEAQQGLDAGESPASVGRKLETSAQVHRNRATIHHGGWAESLRDPSDPDEAGRIADDRRVHDMLMADADRMQELADRLKATRRRPVKKAAAPEVQAAETRADTAEARLINDRLEQLSSARTREKGAEALDGLTMPELRRIGESMGVKGRSKQELRDKILDRVKPEVQTPEAKAELEGRQGQVLERLGRQAAPSVPATKSLSARARDAGIEAPARSFSGVDGGVGEADRRLKAGESPTAVSRFLRERAAQVAKADLNEEGRRFTTVQDKDTLKSIRKSSAEYLRRVATHIQQEARGGPRTRPATVADIAPEVPAKKAVPGRPAPRMSQAAILPNSWGGRLTEIHFHEDGIVGGAIRGLGEDKGLDVDGEPLANALGRLATRAVTGEISQQQMIQNMKQLVGRFPEDSNVRKRLDRMVAELDAPERPPLDLPEGTPAPIQQLMQALSRVPLARKPDRGRDNFNEMDALQEIAQDTTRPEGPRRWRHMESEIRRKLLNHRHESQEGKFEIDRAITEAMRQLTDMVDSARTPSPG
jgi:hypothetical protein